MRGPTLKVTSDFTDQFNDVIKKFKKDKVLVGIPETDPSRSKAGDEKQEINNATLLAINNFGLPGHNIPPRPVMAIGIKNAKAEIAEQYRLAAIKALSDGPRSLDQYYNRAGIIASNSIKKAINSQEGIQEPSDRTIAARKARGFKGTKALIVTGQLRNSITYVVKEGL